MKKILLSLLIIIVLIAGWLLYQNGQTTTNNSGVTAWQQPDRVWDAVTSNTPTPVDPTIVVN
jgi:uncharacterized protein YxeA